MGYVVFRSREQQELERLEQELVKRLNEVSRRKQEYLVSVKEKAAKVQVSWTYSTDFP